MTPTTSVAADHESVTVPFETDDVSAVGAVGGVVSVGGGGGGGAVPVTGRCRSCWISLAPSARL